MRNYSKPGEYWNNQNISVNSQEIHLGLQKFMNDTYKQMSMGLGLAAIISFIISSNPAMISGLINSGIIYILMFALLGLGFVTPGIIMNKSMGMAQAAYWGTTALWGVILSPYLIIYSSSDIATAFLSAAIAFTGMSIVGYTTKKDLTTMGRFLGMATWGILAAVILNLFLQNSGFEMILSILVVMVFSGLTAYETQNLKNMYFQVSDPETRERMGILGALSLFGNFVTLFIWILNLIGNRE